MIVVLTNQKGGVGKTTVTALLAKYIARNHPLYPVIVVDFDPHCGSTMLLMGKRPDPSHPTIYDVLEAESQNQPSGDIFASSLVKIEGEEKLYLVPSSPKLSLFTTNGATTDLLHYAFNMAESITLNSIILVDTGTYSQLVGMGISAADKVIIPMTLSRQTFAPTGATVTMVIRARKQLMGFVPTEAGAATWEKSNISLYEENIKKTEILRQMNPKIYPNVPHSKPVIKGGWVFKPEIPEKFVPTVDAIYADLFGASAIPAPVTVNAPIPVEVNAPTPVEVNASAQQVNVEGGM